MTRPEQSIITNPIEVVRLTSREPDEEEIEIAAAIVMQMKLELEDLLSTSANSKVSKLPWTRCSLNRKLQGSPRPKQNNSNCRFFMSLLVSFRFINWFIISCSWKFSCAQNIHIKIPDYVSVYGDDEFYSLFFLLSLRGKFLCLCASVESFFPLLRSCVERATFCGFYL